MIIENEELCEAQLDDMKLLYEWKNDPITRKSAFSTTVVGWEEHKRWYSNVINSDKIIQLIYVVNEKKVGQVRLDLEETVGIIDYSIAPEYRGNGLGKKIINCLVKYVRENLTEIQTLKACVKNENIHSIKCFEDNGFVSSKKNIIYIEWVKRIR